MVAGVRKVYCDWEGAARVKCGAGGRMRILEAVAYLEVTEILPTTVPASSQHL